METEVQIPSQNPYFPQFNTLGASLYVPEEPTSLRAIAVIVHGHAGHRDYCYQKQLSRTLSIASIRFDFTGCGLQLGKGTQRGREPEERPRTIESDLVDLATVLAHVRNEGYTVSALVGHSRGAVVCLRQAALDHSIPTVVNCSGRFRAHLIHDKVRRNTLDGDGFWERMRAGAGGALVERYTLLSEIASIGEQEMAGIGARLSPDLDVLVLFGSKDHVVPVADAAMFVSDIGGERASLHIIDDADHNFFVQASADGSVQKVNKNGEVAEVVARYLGPESTRRRFLARNLVIRKPRFPPVEGLNNLRDIGGFGRFLTNLLYRSADLSTLTENGAVTLARYVSKIIDLRSDQEVELNGSVGPRAHPLELAGIERVHVPIFRRIDYSPAGIAKFFGQAGARPTARERREGMATAYVAILQHAKPVFAVLFRELVRAVDSADGRGVLVHCSAGKDRTGILCAVVLLFAGCARETVAREYELTTYGLAPDKLAHSMLVPVEAGGVGAGASADTARVEAAPAQHAASSSEAELMRRAIEALDTQFGGVDAYLASCVSRADLDRLRQHFGMTKSRL